MTHPRPAWLDEVANRVPTLSAETFTRFPAPPEGGRDSAVLVLFGPHESGADLLVIERAHTLRSHAGQPAFPGGALDPDDDGPVGAALREAQEEVGLDPASVDVLGVLPALFIPPSGFVVHPVLAWWREPHDVQPVDHGEVASVVRVPVRDLTDPAHRLQVFHPSGWVGPAFDVAGLRVWGFTAGLLDRLLDLAGLEVPWDRSRKEQLDEGTVALARRGHRPGFEAGQDWARPGQTPA